MTNVLAIPFFFFLANGQAAENAPLNASRALLPAYIRLLPKNVLSQPPAPKPAWAQIQQQTPPAKPLWKVAAHQCRDNQPPGALPVEDANIRLAVLGRSYKRAGSGPILRRIAFALKERARELGEYNLTVYSYRQEGALRPNDPLALYNYNRNRDPGSVMGRAGLNFARKAIVGEVWPDILKVLPSHRR